MNRSPLFDHTAWKVNPYSWASAQRLAEALGLPLVAAMVLAGRGFTDPVETRRFLEYEAVIPDPFLFAHMEGAARALSTAIDRGDRITIHGDYDADGITATALMVLGLRRLGSEADWYLPSRFREGYGLSRLAVESIASRGPGLLVTVDCGVNYPDEVSLARQRGLEVVVVDHHQPGPVLPDCHLIHEVAGAYPHGTLCGVGLALKVLHGLYVVRRGAARDGLPEELAEMLDLVAVGTIADLAALIGENRYYVREGLKLIAIGQRVGLRALASVSGCVGSTDAATVAYRLAPRLNAAGRLADPSPPLRLLLTDDEREAGVLAQQLHELNGARQDVERHILEEAIESVENLGTTPPIIVLAGKDWHEGVVGIVAARMVERYHRPAILLGTREGVAKGSGRSIAGYDIMQGLNACAEHLSVYGGHPQAVGLTLETDRVVDFRAAIERHAGALLRPGDLVPTFRSDAVLRGDDLDSDTALALAGIGPFGSGNPRPRLLLVGADIEQAETTRDGSHLRCLVKVDGVRVRGIGFGMGDAAAELRTDGSARLVGAQFRVDAWQGAVRPEFQIEHIGRSSPVGTDDFRRCGPGCPSWKGYTGTEDEEGPLWAAWAPGRPMALHLPVARDLRGRPGRGSALAQVLATGERTLLVGCSLPHMLAGAREHLPLHDLCGEGLACVGRGCLPNDGVAEEPGVLLTEWDVVARSPALAAGRAHIVAVDPPYRASHVTLVDHLGREGANVHLYYGHDERQSTIRLLRFLVHPRFAMVCVYRALEGAAGRGADSTGADILHPKTSTELQDGPVLVRAAELAWKEAGVVLGRRELARALGILRRFHFDQLPTGEAKLDARNIPAYVEAEAEYEECCRLCLNL